MRRGYTLIELMVVVAMIAILSATAYRVSDWGDGQGGPAGYAHVLRAVEGEFVARSERARASFVASDPSIAHEVEGRVLAGEYVTFTESRTLTQAGTEVTWTATWEQGSRTREANWVLLLPGDQS